MIKKIILIGILGLLNINITQAQINETEISVNLNEFDTKHLSQSERVFLNVLIQRSVKQLEKEIKQLELDKINGKITQEEFDTQKKHASNNIAHKIEKSIEILTDSEDYIQTSEQFVDSFSIDNFDFKYTKDDSERSFSISFGNETDSTKTKKKKRIYKHRDAFHFGIGFNNWLDSDNQRYDDPEKKLSGGSSMYYELGIRSSTFLGKEKPSRNFKYRSRTSIDYGVTLISRYYHFNNKSFAINRDDNGLNNIEDIQITKSVFSQTALEVPVTITQRFGKKVGTSFTISAGVYGGINLRSRQKVKYSVNNEDYKAKWISDFNTNRVYGGAQASIGFHSIYLTARYNFSKLFKSSSDIEVYPYTIGLSIEL